MKHLISQLGLLSAAIILVSLISACGETPGQNTEPIVVGNCGAGTYFNEPCVSVTICTPGSSSCQTIPNVLLDTGSYGLRVFASLVTVSLPPQTGNSGSVLAECAPFVGGTSDWGSVKIADVQLGANKASSVPIQVIDSTFGQVPSSCTNPDVNPSESGYNGILGIGLLVQDCGDTCATSADNQVYYTCVGASCTPAVASTGQQVANPVALFSNDNNGVMLQLPAVPSSGTVTVSGTLTFGVGTQNDNTPASGVAAMPTDENGNIVTLYNGQYFTTSYIDSGSNGLYFPPVSANLPACPSAVFGSSSNDADGLFCPTSLISMVATQMGINRGDQKPVNFQIINGNTAVASQNRAFNDVAGTASDGFDWGLPFFFGKTIYFGIDGQSSSLGTGPYVAY